MNSSIDVLKAFLQTIKSINFFQRIFSWRKIRNELIETASALGRLEAEFVTLQKRQAEQDNELNNYRKDLQISEEQKTRLEEAEKKWKQDAFEKDKKIADLSSQLSSATATCKNLQQQLQHLQLEMSGVKEHLRQVQQSLKESADECIKLKSEEDQRKAEHAKAMNTFKEWREQIQNERKEEIEARQQEQIERLEQLKQTWKNHESKVRSMMKSICQKLTVEYVESVPFKGNPDNTIRLADEYIVFDAKSPGSDDLNNFPIYLKDQAEKAKKYAKQEGVKKDIFFVVPSNTLELLKQTVFSHSDHDVYIVSIDVLEPLLLCLQKIETYEFAKQLTPEERENICRIVGRFTHLTKRRIQIDSFFAKQFMEMVLKCDSDLPEDIKKDVAAFEKIEKLNPPSDKRSKVIDNKDLQKEMLQLEMQIKNEGIEAADLSEGLNNIRLYKEEN